MSLLTGGPDSQLLISTSGNGAAENVSPPTGRTVLLTLTQASRPSFRFAQAGLKPCPTAYVAPGALCTWAVVQIA